jgi:hypothetical protein
VMLDVDGHVRDSVVMSWGCLRVFGAAVGSENKMILWNQRRSMTPSRHSG